MPTTTRLYWPVRNTTNGGNLPPDPACNPAPDASWHVVTDRLVRLVIARGAVTGMTMQGANTSSTLTSGQRHTIAQGVTDPLPAGVVSGAVKMVQRCSVTNSNADMHLTVTVRVVSSDGSVVRGTLVAAADATLEVPETQTTRTIGPVAMTPVTALAGDRIVVEFGARRAVTASVARSVNMTLGDPAASPPDWPFDNTTTDEGVPWVELILDDPHPPTNLTADPSFESIDIEWEPPSAGPTPTGYSVTVNGVQTDVGNVTNWTATNLHWNRPFDIHVRAYSASTTSIPAMLTVSTLLPAMPWIPAPLINATARRWWDGPGNVVVDPETGEHFWWDGAELVPADLLGWWDGADVQPAALLGYWDGATVQPLA